MNQYDNFTYKLTECDKEAYVKQFKNAVQFLMDNAEELIYNIEDNMTKLSIWINVDNGDVLLENEYSKEYKF